MLNLINSKIIREKALKKWKSYLQSIITGEEFFPLNIKFAGPTPSEALKNYALLDKWISDLRDSSKENKGFGYTVEYTLINNRRIGKQNMPDKIYFENESDYLKFTGLSKEADIFKSNYKILIDQYPELHEWVLKYPQKLIEYNSVFTGLLKVADYFKINPKPQVYIREIDAGVHSKFIENNKGILREILDIVIADNVNPGETDFEKRFNLKSPQPLIRMKILDLELANHYFSGITDISIPSDEFSKLSLPVTDVIIIENKTSFSNILNFLTLPQLKNTIALFGKGFGVTLCGKAEWLNKARIRYWGDIDPHGFMILSNFRKYFPHTESVMMDEKTFQTFYDCAVEGEVLAFTMDLRLSSEEAALFEKLNVKGTVNRLEQEFIGNDYVVACLGGFPIRGFKKHYRVQN